MFVKEYIMRNGFLMKLIPAVAIVLLLGCIISMVPNAEADGSSCGGVDRGLSDEHKAALATAIAKQLNVSKVDVLGSFKSGDWSIINVDSHEADEAFLFYAENPLTNHYITLWSGAATTNEEASIRDWALKNAPKIPSQLATCFAWYVTKGRN
jgi:hypothetical protein